MDCQFIPIYGNIVTSQTANFSRVDINRKISYCVIFNPAPFFRAFSQVRQSCQPTGSTGFPHNTLMQSRIPYQENGSHFFNEQNLRYFIYNHVKLLWKCLFNGERMSNCSGNVYLTVRECGLFWVVLILCQKRFKKFCYLILLCKVFIIIK